MIQHEGMIDRKLIAIIGASKVAITKMVQSGVKVDYFQDMYQPLVQEMLDYYKSFFELLTPSALEQILLDKQLELQTITAIVTTFEDIIDSANGQNLLAELDYFLDRIKRRKSLQICEEASKSLASAVVNGKIDAARTVMSRTIVSVDGISRSDDITEGTLSDFTELRTNKYEERKLHPERFRGIQSGFPVLDKATDGFQPGDLILYVAESGGGKSVNMLHSGFSAWKEKYPGAGVGANVALFSLEMDWMQYLRRFDAMHGSLDALRLKSASLQDHEYTAWIECLEFQKKRQNLFYLVDMPAGCTTLYIRNKLEEIKMKHPDHPIDLIIIDYLGIMEPSQDVDGADWLKQGIISLECKQLARQERVPVLTAVQETRDSIKDTKNTNKNIAILGRSHMIATNANVILYSKLHEKAEPEEDFELFKSYNDNPNVVDYQVVKSRDSKKVGFKAGADFSRMYLQPQGVAEDEQAALANMVVNNKNKPEVKPVLKNPEDEDEFDRYYERIRPHKFSSTQQPSAS